MAANICIFQGHFVADPEVTRGTTQDGREWVKARFKLGVSRPGSDDKADFPEFYCFGAPAGFVERNFKKGASAVVQASFENDSYTKDGKKVYTSIFRASEVNFG